MTLRRPTFYHQSEWTFFKNCRKSWECNSQWADSGWNVFSSTFSRQLLLSVWRYCSCEPSVLMRQNFYFCNFVKATNRNFVMDIFLKHVLNTVSQDLLKCPIKKGSYAATGVTVKEIKSQTSLPPFLVSGQEINFAIIFKSFIRRKPEIICSMTLDMIVSWFRIGTIFKNSRRRR